VTLGANILWAQPFLVPDVGPSPKCKSGATHVRQQQSIVVQYMCVYYSYYMNLKLYRSMCEYIHRCEDYGVNYLTYLSLR
jgi:hypothetical protein